MPKTTVDYFQRIGRVGRMGQKGATVTNFVRRKDDSELSTKISKVLNNQSENWDKIMSSKPPRKNNRRNYSNRN